MPLIVAACGTGAATSLPPASRTAGEACLAAAGAGSWQVAVEIDRANTSVLAMERGADIASCETAMSAGLGGYGNPSVGVGTHPRRRRSH
jgi:galactitol-specific phosphotransferase system IIB component